MKPALIILFLFFAGCSNHPTRDRANFIVEKGETITIKLNSNLTIPYKWKRISQNSLLEPIDEKYEAGNSKVGGGGLEYWQFRAIQKGTDTLRFIQAHTQVEEADSNAVIKTFTVEIK